MPSRRGRRATDRPTLRCSSRSLAFSADGLLSSYSMIQWHFLPTRVVGMMKFSHRGGIAVPNAVRSPTSRLVLQLLPPLHQPQHPLLSAAVASCRCGP